MIEYCNWCDHWFCSACRRDYFWRGLEKVNQIIGKRRADCCNANRCHFDKEDHHGHTAA